MTADAEEVARLLRDDYASPRSGGPPALAGLFAETVALRHGSGLPSDGEIPGARLRELSIAEHAAARRALPDMMHEDVNVVVDGAFVEVRATTKGTLADGTPVRVASDIRLEVRGGKVVMLEARFAEDQMAAWAAVLAAGDFAES